MKSLVFVAAISLLLIAPTFQASAEDQPVAPAVAVAAVEAAPPIAIGDAAAGEKVFLQCRACHQVGPTAKNAVGPVLNGIIGRKAGTYVGYNYSEANKNSGIVWTQAKFEEYIQNPKGVVVGTKMSYPGLKKETDVGNILAYLLSFNAEGQKATQ